MHVFSGPLRLALLAVALIAAVPAATIAQDTLPQCSDGVDNDADNAIDGADAGCGDGSDDDETDSVYSGIQKVTVALPVVTLQGTVNRRGVVNVSRLIVRAQPGSTMLVSCQGKRCPFRTLRRTMITKKLRLGTLERRFRPTLALEMRIARPGQLGKYVRYKVRRRKPPRRSDKCLDQTTGAIKGCFDE